MEAGSGRDQGGNDWGALQNLSWHDGGVVGMWGEGP